MPWGFAIAAAGSVIGSAISADAAGDAADTQAASTASGIAEQRRQYDTTREDFAPYRATGVRALGELEGEMGRMPTAAEVMSDPGYQFGMDQGQRALDRRIAAMGGRVSGRSLMAAARFGTDYASSGYNAAYQRRQDRLNRLAALAGIGQTATGSSAAAGANSTNAITGLIERGGEAAGAAQMARGNIWGNATNQIAALYGRQQGGSAWANPSANPFSNRGGSFGTDGLDDFYYGNGTGGD